MVSARRILVPFRVVCVGVLRFRGRPLAIEDGHDDGNNTGVVLFLEGFVEESVPFHWAKTFGSCFGR